MEKKNYNLEIFFESQKKSFVILSRNKISFEDIKQKTMREFNISKEFEKDMKYSISSNDKIIIIQNDSQILKNLEEISKNNYYLKLIFNINNNKYIYNPPKNSGKINTKIRPNKVCDFFISANNNILINKKSDDKKYIIEIKKLKEELEMFKSVKIDKGEFDIRKFDERYRDLINKNKILEQKISELEKENQTIKIEKNKTNFIDNLSFEKNFDNDYLIKEIEKCVSKLIGEHDNNVITQIVELKSAVDVILKEQKTFNDKFDNKDNFNLFIQKDDDFENEKKFLNNNNKVNKIDIIRKNNKDNNNILFNNEFNNNINDKINLVNIDDNSYDLDNLAEIINQNEKDSANKKENNKKKNIDNKNIKKNINFYDDEEDEKNSKSSNSLKKNKESNNLIKELKNNFLDDNKKRIDNNIILRNNLDSKKSNKNYYTKYTDPNIKKKISNQKKIFNKSKPDLSEDEIINYDSSYEMYSEFKNTKSKLNSSNSQKNLLSKMNKKANKLSLNTPSAVFTSDKNKKNSFVSIKKVDTTPNNKINSVKENIGNYFINIFQSIFFYGNNSYVNMLNISDKLINKLKEGLRLYRNNLEDIKDICIKYISFSIVPIINDINTKDYQRKIIKNKISTISDIVKIDKNYFDKEYKEIKEDKKEDKNNFEINITHAKINEFRKLYDLKEKDYPDELIVKALIRYRGNKELAFQYLFY